MRKLIQPPAHLTKESKQLFTRLAADYKIGDQGGLLLLANVCEARDRCEEARRAIKRDGAIVRDRWGQAKPHPGCVVEKDARHQLLAALKLLRLEPDAVA